VKDKPEEKEDREFKEILKECLEHDIRVWFSVGLAEVLNKAIEALLKEENSKENKNKGELP